MPIGDIFADPCDIWINQANEPQGVLDGQKLADGAVVCLDPSQSYSNVAFSLATDDIVLDCQGATLTGSDICIDVIEAEEARVESCRLDGCATGIRVANSPGAVIARNEFLGAGLAVDLHSSPGAELIFNAACGAATGLFRSMAAQRSMETCVAQTPAHSAASKKRRPCPWPRIRVCGS